RPVALDERASVSVPTPTRARPPAQQSRGTVAPMSRGARTDVDDLGRVVTFYSYKGGTGRTMALANVAWLLASNGYRVLTVDWDLESPGLHRFFHPFLKDKTLRSSDGIIDLVRRYVDTTMQMGGGDATLDMLADVWEYASTLDWAFPQGGLIDFVPA